MSGTLAVLGSNDHASIMSNNAANSSSSGALGKSTKKDDDDGNVAVQTVVLEAESELRLEVSFVGRSSGNMCTVTLMEGSAERWGTELAVGASLPVVGNAAICTWHGCTLEVRASPPSALQHTYTTTEIPAAIAVLNTHAQLEALRDDAVVALDAPDQSPGAGAGPRVLLAGPPDSGKTCTAEALAAYAVKVGRHPLRVDLDVSHNALSTVPGVLSAVPALPGCQHGPSLELWYGSTDPTAHPDLYREQLTALSAAVDARLDRDPEARASGILIDTSGHVEDEKGFGLLKHAIAAFSVDVVLVLGHDRLYSMLTAWIKSSLSSGDANGNKPDPNGGTNRPKIIKLPRSGGVVSRDAAHRLAARNLAVQQYFYGDVVAAPRSAGASSSSSSGRHAFVNQYTPSSLELPLDSLRVYRVTSVALAASMLPLGKASVQTTDPIQLTPVPLRPHDRSSLQKHSVLAVCHPTAVEVYDRTGLASDLCVRGVAGYVSVERIGPDTVGLLAPASGGLPSQVLLLGDITWME